MDIVGIHGSKISLAVHQLQQDRVCKQLMAEGLELEVFDGHIPVVEVSALANTGLDTLVETIAVMAELLEIRAEPDGKAHAYVIESRYQKGMGLVADFS